MTLEPVLSKLLRGGTGAERARREDARAARRLAPAGRQPARPHRQRPDHRAGRGDHGHRLAVAGQRLGVVGARAVAAARSWPRSCPSSTRLQRAPAPGGRAVPRLARLDVQGPPDDPRRDGERHRSRSATAAAAASKRCRALLWGAIDQAGNKLAADAGPEPGRLALERDGRGDHVRARAAARTRCATPTGPTGIQQVAELLRPRPGGRLSRIGPLPG